jgi:radical SAM superfamily enzyme YgiQ (UPF0313 family)
MADIVLINPKFEVSYWGMEHALEMLGKKANLPVACLPLLAALTPEGHTVTLIDENVEPIDWDRCAKADIVGLTGMSVQRFRMKEILTKLKGLGCFTVIGGPWITVQEDYFDDLADVIFIGEAEETWPQFLREWPTGTYATRYEQEQKSDMTKLPVPRFDLLKMNRYAFGSLQFSRGCPFQCEFCDIIVTFGRRPRLKTSKQVIAEIEAMYKSGMRSVFVVDDNLIGNKKAIKEVLREVVAWQRHKGYPLSFTTEASLDLADDPELLSLMTQANFVAVFVGIESPNEDALRETKKFQNVRAGDSILGRVHTIQRAGMDVWCGMIVGFDSDDNTIFDRQKRFLKESRITSSMIGMLHAIPKTPLHARLAEEGRLDYADQPEFGTNVIPLNMSQEELLSGYLDVLTTVHNVHAFFDRLDELFIKEKMNLGNRQTEYHDYWKKHPLQWLKSQAYDQSTALFAYHRLMKSVPDPVLREIYRSRIKNLYSHRKEGGVRFYYILKAMIHWHVHRMVKSFTTGERKLVNSF